MCGRMSVRAIAMIVPSKVRRSEALRLLPSDFRGNEKTGGFPPVVHVGIDNDGYMHIRHMSNIGIIMPLSPLATEAVAGCLMFVMSIKIEHFLWMRQVALLAGNAVDERG